MAWDSYRLRYIDAKKAISQSRITSLAANEALKDFPKNVSPNQHKEVKEWFTNIIEIVERTDQESLGSRNHQLTSNKIESYRHVENINDCVFHLLVLHALGGKGVEHLEFGSLLIAQELVILLAHVDAFLSDSIRAMCKAKPNILISDKKISWGDVIKAGNWDDLLSYLTEEYSYILGWKSISEWINYISERHGIKISLPEPIQRLSEAEQLRHIIIHNGGRVSQEYLNKTEKTDVELGEVITISQDYNKQVAEDALLLLSNIYFSVSKKIFGINLKEKDDFFLAFPGN
jgi:hypothetical protein